MTFRFVSKEYFIHFIRACGVVGPVAVIGFNAREDKFYTLVGTIYISEDENDLTEFVVARHMDKLGIGGQFKNIEFQEYEFEEEQVQLIEEGNPNEIEQNQNDSEATQ